MFRSDSSRSHCSIPIRAARPALGGMLLRGRVDLLTMVWDGSVAAIVMPCLCHQFKTAVLVLMVVMSGLQAVQMSYAIAFDNSGAEILRCVPIMLIFLFVHNYESSRFKCNVLASIRKRRHAITE